MCVVSTLSAEKIYRLNWYLGSCHRHSMRSRSLDGSRCRRASCEQTSSALISLLLWLRAFSSRYASSSAIRATFQLESISCCYWRVRVPTRTSFFATQILRTLGRSRHHTYPATPTHQTWSGKLCKATQFCQLARQESRCWSVLSADLGHFTGLLADTLHHRRSSKLGASLST